VNPILSSRTRVGAYLLGWTPFVAIQTLQLVLTGWPFYFALCFSMTAGFLAAGLFLSSGYICWALPLRDTRPWVLGSSLGLASLLMGALWAWLVLGGARLLSLLPSLAILSRLMPSKLVLYIGFTGIGSLFYLATAALNYVLMAHEHSRETDKTEQNLRVLAREAELKALRAQLNPHFLFNSLNSISALTTLDPKRAREMCVLLSDFLRKSLKLGERPLVNLSEELDLLRSYLAIEHIRFGSRLNVDWTIAPEAEDVQIPTLLLQPLVENAIKHGIAAIPEGGTIRISAIKKGGFVEIQLENPVDQDAEPPIGLGMGLKQVKMRLQGRYGADIFFDAVLKDGLHKVLMVFPTEVPE
jgi:two-component system, LytTR family, sensor histidine kinase AlgZ